MARHTFFKSACVGYVLAAGVGAVLLTLQGCAQGEPIAPGAIDLQPDSAAAQQALTDCVRVFAPSPELAEQAAEAAARWSAATGCDIEMGDGGWRIVYAESIPVVDLPGEFALGTTDLERQIIYVARDQIGGDATFTVTHEMGHALDGVPGHAASGLMKAGAPVGSIIDATSLELICSGLPCAAFVPEPAAATALELDPGLSLAPEQAPLTPELYPTTGGASAPRRMHT